MVWENGVICGMLQLLVAVFRQAVIFSKTTILFYKSIRQKVPITLSRFSITLVYSWEKINFRPSTRELKILLKRWNVTCFCENTNLSYIPLFHQDVWTDKRNDGQLLTFQTETNENQYFYHFDLWRCHKKFITQRKPIPLQFWFTPSRCIVLLKEESHN